MMKKVLLFHPPTDLGYSMFTPLGLASIHAATPDGYEAHVRDMTLRRWADCRLEDFEQYDIIGVSFRYTYCERETKRFLGALAGRYPDKMLIAGGQHATYDLDGVFSCGVRYVVRFSGEQTWAELLAALLQGRDVRDIAGLAYRSDATTVSTQDRPFADPNTLAIPSFHVFRAGDYPFVRGLHAASIEASRGCPNRCRFCSNPALWRGMWAAKSTDRVVEEVDRVQRLGFTFLFFADDNFGASSGPLRDLLEALTRRTKKIAFMALMQPRTVAQDPEVLDLAWRAGMRIISLDTNSIDEHTLALYDRSDGIETVRRALDAVKRSRIAAVSNVIVGAPGETKSAMLRNIRFTKRHADIFSCGTLEPRPGSRYWRDSDWGRTELLCMGEPLLHERPDMVRRVIHQALLSYYLNPRHVLRALLSRKEGVRIIFRLHYRLYFSAVLRRFANYRRSCTFSGAR